ncbi:hypothetical protein [Arsenicicoccus dermatophilus]|uniref:hypothetical protein n=1 Tax=Arsenicicoccus dermatophilus TaxID=1076331 RepID=UPI001F4C6BBB|nr:hypothetical protein [Arsenicicoccus dermatophilus]MCH8613397.1 hypothetical protein [Arsenicicoccus dermatophilus]
MAVHTGPHLRPSAPVVTWFIAPLLVALGVVLAFATVVTVVMGMAPFAVAAIIALVASVAGFWSVLDRPSA